MNNEPSGEGDESRSDQGAYGDFEDELEELPSLSLDENEASVTSSHPQPQANSTSGKRTDQKLKSKVTHTIQAGVCRIQNVRERKKNRAKGYANLTDETLEEEEEEEKEAAAVRQDDNGQDAGSVNLAHAFKHAREWDDEHATEINLDDDDADMYAASDGLSGADGYRTHEPGEVVERRKTTHLRMALMSAYWLSRSAVFAAIPMLLVPHAAETYFPENWHGRAIGILNAAAAVVNVLGAPLAGGFSDRWKTPNRFGRRLPLLGLGTLIGVLTLPLLGALDWAGDGKSSEIKVLLYCFFALTYTVLNGADSLAVSGYSALIPDLIIPEQVNIASAWMGFGSMLGYLVGTILGVLELFVGIFACYCILAVVLTAGAVLTFLSNDAGQNMALYEKVKVAPSPPSMRTVNGLWHLFSDPFRCRNFLWVFVTRFLVMFGFNTVTAFLENYVRDSIPSPYVVFGIEIESYVLATALMMGIVLVGSVIAAFGSGFVANKIGRKPVVYIASGLMAGVILVYVFWVNYQWDLFLIVFFGIGYGSYISVDWALAADALPSSGSFATDMGIWHVSTNLPMLVGPLIGGLMIDILNPVGDAIGIDGFGYRLVWIMCVIAYVLAIIFTRNISTSDEKTNGSAQQFVELHDETELAGGVDSSRMTTMREPLDDSTLSAYAEELGLSDPSSDNDELAA